MLRKVFTKKRGKAGFTLIELLVTITIISIMSIMTFAITISALNTFGKQKEIIDAMDMKEVVCVTLKEHLRRRSKIGLISENMAIPTDAAIPDLQFGESFKDEFGYYVIDPRLKEYHMLFSEGGRIYTVTSNLDGKYYTESLVPDNAMVAYPRNTKGLASNIDNTNTLDGKFGKEPFMFEDMYEGYYVDLKFKPIFTNTQGRYRDLQVIVTIYDDPSMTPEHQAAKGTETFHLLNVENRQSAIKYQNNMGYTQVGGNIMKDPQPEGFTFCYFM